MSSTPLPKPPRIFEIIGPAVENVINRYIRPVPRPLKFTVKAMLERSPAYELMIEKSAQLETLRILETEHRTKLVAALGQLAYASERAKFRIETRQWVSMAGMLDPEADAVIKAGGTHDEMLAAIAALGRDIDDMQRTLDDTELWEKEADNG